MARGHGFATPCPNKQGKNAYFSKVSDASGTASDVANVRKDCKHFGPPLWVILVEERGPFGRPSSVFLLRVYGPTVFVGQVGKKGPRVGSREEASQDRGCQRRHTPVGGGLGPAPEDSEKKVLLRALCM